MTIKRIAYFISSHGFGHAARAAAVMETLSESNPGVRFEIFTNEKGRKLDHFAPSFRFLSS